MAIGIFFPIRLLLWTALHGHDVIGTLLMPINDWCIHKFSLNFALPVLSAANFSKSVSSPFFSGRGNLPAISSSFYRPYGAGIAGGWENICRNETSFPFLILEIKRKFSVIKYLFIFTFFPHMQVQVRNHYLFFRLTGFRVFCGTTVPAYI